MSSNRAFKKADLKIVMVGDASIGKTCLVLRYIDRQFQESISDTAGSERYTGMNRFYYRNAAAAILCFDVTSRQSFENISAKYLPILNSLNSTKLTVVVGTKCDLLHRHSREVTVTEAKELSKKLNPWICETSDFIPYFETSSKTGANVDRMFEYIFEQFYPNGGSEPRPIEAENNISLLASYNNNNASPNVEKSSCC